MRWDKTSVRNGMFVMGTQGERIGKVIRCDTDTFVVADRSLYPLDTAIYSFSPTAYKNLSKGAKAFAFQPSAVGVARATDVVRLTSPAAVALCKK